MSVRQIMVLAVAFIAAIGALVVIRGMRAEPAAPAARPAPIAGEQVLVAARDVHQGAALTAGDLAWRIFPTESVSTQFVRQSARPQATADMQGAVTRRAFLSGEPIVASDIVGPDGRGFLAAQLRPGYRAVAIEIQANAAAGGFIQPNDHVDVVVTTKAEGDNNAQSARSSIVLQDVRVLALDEHIQTQTTGDAPERIEARTAVLELSAQDARVMASARRMGDVSLALRGVEAEPAGFRAPSAAPTTGGGDQGGVMLHSFGHVGGAS